MPSRRTLALSGLALLATVALSGCLVEEFVPEPWVWRDAGEAGGDFSSPDYADTVEVPLAERTNRVRIVANVTLDSPGDNPLASSLREGPGLNLTVELGSGASYRYFFTESETVRDLYPGSGDGDVVVKVEARGQGSWSVDLDAYEPEYPDWRWYAFWERV